MKTKGCFIVVDGIAGSGKSTILKSIHTWAQTRNYKLFRLNDWEHSAPPSYKDIQEYDVYFTYEPTRHWVGASIRYELSREEDPYGGEELAHAFALDRQIMYRRFIIPALEAGKIIIQDRSVSTSLVYQPIMPRSVSFDEIINLPGNQLALKYAPDALILTQITAELAHKRIHNRQDEAKGVFAQLDFLKQLEQRYSEPWLKNLFEANGTTLYPLDTSGTLEETTTHATQLIQSILTNN
jgi:thymidylate kinase